MILEVTGDQIAQLNDSDLRTLVGYLCEREVRAQGHSPSVVTWGGDQNASDGGIDVRVALPAKAAISGYVPKATSGFQVKAQDMPRGAILEEMAPKGVALPSIAALATRGGAYIIVSSKGSLSDTSLKKRKAAMVEAVKGISSSSSLTLDFYDRRRIASWVNQHAGLASWVREKLGLPLSGWRPFGDWSSSPVSEDVPYLHDAQTRLVGPSLKSTDGLNAEQAVAKLREILGTPRGIVRLVGLSGVGKTRLIQALFDERIGAGALARSDALYTDNSDDPNPAPQDMLSWLINAGHRIVLIVDNCGMDLHRKLASKITNSSCLISVITVEYDINDDEPENTDIFKLEPASPDLIENVLKIHYPNIASPSRHVIARFSEGNSRVALSMAETAKNGESLAKLNDTDLFERLFRQQKVISVELLDAAKACALLYSFDGETLEGNEVELVPLAKLVGQTGDQIHKQVAELFRRQLVQKRGKWRAILPHALANRLAKRALEDIPLQRLEEGIVNGTSARMMQSFSRRIGYLHGVEQAAVLAEKWLSLDGLLAQLGKLNAPGDQIFENIAPVDPTTTLGFIEEVASNNEDWFFTKQNKNKAQIVKVIRSLAYDPALFAQSSELLKRFAIEEATGSSHSAVDTLKSLFCLYLSGTHASVAQRTAFIKALLESTVSKEQDLGLVLLGEMLKTSHFTSHYTFEFGAWKRDFGFHPESDEEVRDWFIAVIETGRAAEASGQTLPERVRHVMAMHVAELIRAGMVDEIIALANTLARKGGWSEGWIGVRRSMKRSSGKLSSIELKKLEELERCLRPSDLAGMIRSYAFSPAWSALDIADLDDEVDLKPIEARQKIWEVCTDLGQQLVGDDALFRAMLPEIVSADSQRTFALGQGLSTGCHSLAKCWEDLRNTFLESSEQERHPQLLAGFLTSAMVRSPEETDVLFDGILADPRFHAYLLYWQVNAAVNSNAYERMMAALALDSVPITGFMPLAWGRNHEGLDDAQFQALLQGIMDKPGGSAVATQIIGMRFFGRRSDQVPISELLKATARAFLSKVELEIEALQDHMIGEVIEVAFDRPEYENQARAFCARIIAALKSWKIYGGQVGEITTALAKTFPVVILDMLVEQAADQDGTRHTVFREIRSNRACPLDVISDNVWMAWAAQRPAFRYELLARMFRFSEKGDEDHANGWSTTALKLIEVAPEPVKVLDAFLERFRPSGWSGSLADTLATRMPLLEALILHPSPEIAAWAIQRVPDFAACIERERAREAGEDRVRNQTFE